MKRFSGKRVLVTGAGSGLGLSMARTFAREGASLVLTDRNVESLEEARIAVLALGAEVHTRVVDVSDRDAVFAMAAEILANVGPVDVLVNNAGIGHTGTLDSTNQQTWERLVAIDLMGPIHNVDAFLPSMKARRQGQIVNVSSGQVFFRMPTWGAYSAVKSGLATWSETLHWELRPYGITVTTVYPFLVKTRFYDDAHSDSPGGRLSLRLLPMAAQSPDSVARIIARAVARKRRSETVNPINRVGQALQLLPPVSAIVNMITNRALAGSPR